MDAGGTNFVFSAIQGSRQIVDAITLPGKMKVVQRSLDTIESGFRLLGDALANSMTLFDGLVDIGGGISRARDLYMPLF